MTAPTRTCPKCGAVYGPDVIFCQNDRTVLDQSAGAMTGKIIADRYRVISHIGEGGMGQVYLAEHIHMKRKCAVKFLNPELAGNAGALKRFIREASNASRIDHPNVVTIYDFGEMQDGSVYLAMEFVEGESLRKRIEREAAMPRDVVASIVRQTASALHAAHALGIVHRDLKPDNIMLVTRDGETRVKVVDFGIAKAKGVEQKVTVTGAIVGTPDYMSPEQLMAEEVDGRTDQYSLALVAVKMLTGKLPFAATTSIESMTSRLTTAPLPLRQLRTDIAWPQMLQDVIGRALSSDAAQRFASAVDFSRAFDKAIGGMGGPLSATVPDLPVGRDIITPTRVREPSAPPPRRTWPLALAAGLVLMVGGGTAIWVGIGRKPLPAASSDLSARQEAPRDTTTPAPQPLTAVRQQADTSTPAAIVPPPAGDPVLLSRPGERTAAAAPDTLNRVTARATQRPAPVDSQAVAEKAITALPEPARPAPADTSPPAPRQTPPAASPAPAALSPAEVVREFSAIRSLVSPEAPAASLSAAVTRIDVAIPRLGDRNDSLRFLYVRAQAQALQGDQGAACRTLATGLGLAKGSRLEMALTQTSTQLNCP